MGFAVNLALSLHTKYTGTIIRFFSDDAILFQKLFSGKVPHWIEYTSLEILKSPNPPPPSALIYSFFDYPLQKEYLSKFPYHKTIISFSYFLLHKGLESLHGTTYVLESGYDTVIHFIPSLLPKGGGVIINPLIEKEIQKSLWKGIFDGRKNFFQRNMHYLFEDRKWPIQDMLQKKWIFIFVYPSTLAKILSIIENDTSGTIFWISGYVGDLQTTHNCRIVPFLSLVDYGVFQNLCDVNIVRGENSLCQGLLSWKPLLWDIYKESNGAHLEKTEDFLTWIVPYFESNLEYISIARDFMNTGNPESFARFLQSYQDFEEIGERISREVHRESDLVEKLLAL